MASFDPMQDPLSQLRDIHVPMAPHWWPPAPGWWLLTLIIVTLAVLGIRFAWQRYRDGAPLRRARSDLEQSFSYFSIARQGGELAAKRTLADTVNAVLKRLALVRYPRAEVAELSGARWNAFLDETANTDQFTTGMGRVLGDERFAPAFNYDPAALRLAAQYWIDEHSAASRRSGFSRDRARSARSVAWTNCAERGRFVSRLKPLLRPLLRFLPHRKVPRQSETPDDQNP